MGCGAGPRFEYQGVGDVVKLSEAFSEEAAAQLADLENPR